MNRTRLLVGILAVALALMWTTASSTQVAKSNADQFNAVTLAQQDNMTGLVTLLSPSTSFQGSMLTARNAIDASGSNSQLVNVNVINGTTQNLWAWRDFMRHETFAFANDCGNLTGLHFLTAFSPHNTATATMARATSVDNGNFILASSLSPPNHVATLAAFFGLDNRGFERMAHTTQWRNTASQIASIRTSPTTTALHT